MAMVDVVVDGSSVPADSQHLTQLAWPEGCRPPGAQSAFINRVPASAGGKGWNVTSAG